MNNNNNNNNNNNRKILFTILSISMYKQKHLYKGNTLHFSLKVFKKLVRKKSGSAFHCWKVRKGVTTIVSCIRFTEWKNVVAAKITGRGPEWKHIIRISRKRNEKPQASKAHVTSVWCKLTFSQESRCRVTTNRWDFVWELKHWALRTLNIIILNKGGSPLMYSCVFWCEFVDLVGFVWLLLLEPCHSLHSTM